VFGVTAVKKMTASARNITCDNEGLFNVTLSQFLNSPFQQTHKKRTIISLIRQGKQLLMTLITLRVSLSLWMTGLAGLRFL
jgi:hypothetical protein